MKKLLFITSFIIILCSFSVFAIVGHPAAQIFPGLFATGNYTFGNNVLFIDSTNNRVGIGTVSPGSKLEIESTGNTDLKIKSTGTDSIPFLDLENDARRWTIGIRGDASDSLKIKDVTGGYYPLEIDTAGVITLPKQSAARAYLAGNQVISTETWTKLLLTTENYDVQSEFANNKFTAKTAGFYLIIGNVEISTLGANQLMYGAIYKNSIAQVYSNSPTSVIVSPYVSFSDIIYLNVDDYAELWIYHTHGGDRNADSGTTQNFMAIHKLS